MSQIGVLGSRLEASVAISCGSGNRLTSPLSRELPNSVSGKAGSTGWGSVAVAGTLKLFHWGGETYELPASASVMPLIPRLIPQAAVVSKTFFKTRLPLHHDAKVRRDDG